MVITTTKKRPLNRIYPPVKTIDFIFGYGQKNTKIDVLKHQTSLEI